MAGNSFVQVPPDSTGKKVDCVSLSIGTVDVFRQRICIGDGSSTFETAVVLAGKLQVGGQVSVTGSVAISNPVTLISLTGTASVVIGAGTNNIGAVSIAAGTAKVGFIGKISATTVVSGQVSVTGSVALNAGAAHIGEVNISVMPAVVLAAGAAHIGEVNISLMPVVTVTGGVAISGTATAVIGGFLDPSGQQRNVVDSVNTALRVNVVAGGAGGGIVFGANQDGASATAAAVLVGGRDSAGGGLVRTFLTDASGRLAVNVNGTVPVSGQLSVTGSVALNAGAAHIGEVNISVMPAVVLAAGAANIGTINNISAAVVIAAGAAHIGEVNISVFPALVAGTAHIGEVNISLMPAVNISVMPAVVLAAGAAHVGEVNISLMPTVNVNLAAQSAGFIVAMQGAVANNASITAGNSPVLMGGRVKTSASTTATAHAAVFLWMDKAGRNIVQLNHPSLHPSATHGPKSVTLSASANTVLIASAGTACIFVDGLLVTSNLAAVTRCDVYETPSSAAPEVSTYLAIGGGGYQVKFDPPWQLSAGQALSARLKPSASAQVIVMVHFHVGPA